MDNYDDIESKTRNYRQIAHMDSDSHIFAAKYLIIRVRGYIKGLYIVLN